MFVVPCAVQPLRRVSCKRFMAHLKSLELNGKQCKVGDGMRTLCATTALQSVSSRPLSFFTELLHMGSQVQGSPFVGGLKARVAGE
jgi:hypothetical protein